MINISFCYDAKGETYEIHVRFIGQYGSHEFEYAVADLLRHNGFREVQVTQASNDYGIDILAKRKNTSYAIQCKRYSGNVGNKAVQEAGLGMDFYHCDAAAVITNSAYTKQAIKLAQVTGVRLWDRNYLAELIDNYFDDEETESSDFDYTISIPEKDLIKTETKCGKIQLEKGIYLENDKIHIGHDSYSFIGADKLRVFVLWSIWIILICSTLLFSFQPIIGIIGIICGIYLISYYKRIKNSLDNYLRIRIKNKEKQP